MNALLNAALSYADRGWHVLPLHSVDKNGRCSCGQPCKTPGKHPRLKHGLLESSNDFIQIKNWWSLWPDANIGVRTGRVSDLWVLDIDNGKSLVSADGVIFPEGENTLRSLENMAGRRVPETLTSMTGSGGRHMLFTYPKGENIYRNKVKVAPSIDVRGENGYIVVPPSLHPSGKHYQWVDESEPIAPAPGWLLTLQGKDSEPFQPQDEVGEGGRNDYLFRLASRLVGEGRDKDEVATLVIGTNQRVCNPPLDDSEVMLIISSAVKYDPNPQEAELVFDEEEANLPALNDGEAVALSISELFRHPPEPKRPLVHGGVLDEGDGLILAGASNVGKSWLAMDLAASLVTGGTWLGRFDCEPSRVLYIDEESSTASDYNRFKMIFHAHLFPSEVVASGELPLFLAIQRGVKLDTPKGFTILSRLMTEYRPDVVIFDALVRMHSGDENSTRDMSGFFDKANQLKRAYGAAFVFLHHVRKPMKDDPGDDADQMRGNSDIKGWPDTVFMARENDTKDGIILTHAKSRDHEKIERFEVGRFIDGEEASFKFREQYREKPVTNEQKRQAIIDIIKKNTNVKASIGFLALEMGLSAEAVASHVKVLADAGVLAQVNVRGFEPWYVMSGDMEQASLP